VSKIRIPFVVGDRALSFLMDDHDAKDHIVNLIAEHGLQRYEAPTPQLVAGFALAFGENFLDIGANTGVYSLLYGCLAPSATVYAFEPLVAVAKALGENIRLNPQVAERIHIEPYALSDRDGSYTWYETINDHGLFSTSSSLSKDRAKSIGNYRTSTVRARTLDSFTSEHGLKFRLAKIDVEGYEPAVLAGAGKTIQINRPVLIIEVLRDADFEALNSWTSAMDYVAYAACQDIVLRLDRVEYIAGAQNHVLCPSEHLDKLASVSQLVGLRLR